MDRGGYPPSRSKRLTTPISTPVLWAGCGYQSYIQNADHGYRNIRLSKSSKLVDIHTALRRLLSWARPRSLKESSPHSTRSKIARLPDFDNRAVIEQPRHLQNQRGGVPESIPSHPQRRPTRSNDSPPHSPASVLSAGTLPSGAQLRAGICDHLNGCPPRTLNWTDYAGLAPSARNSRGGPIRRPPPMCTKLLPRQCRERHGQLHSVCWEWFLRAHLWARPQLAPLTLQFCST